MDACDTSQARKYTLDGREVAERLELSIGSSYAAPQRWETWFAHLTTIVGVQNFDDDGRHGHARTHSAHRAHRGHRMSTHRRSTVGHISNVRTLFKVEQGRLGPQIIWNAIGECCTPGGLSPWRRKVLR